MHTSSASVSSNPRLRWLASSLTIGALCFGAWACSDPSPYYEGGDVDTYCRENPRDCEGDIGGDCIDSRDCFDGTCCRDKNCGGGMCTYRCSDDRDCPNAMLCEHDYCFFRCSSDRDCGSGQSCEHGKTICEYDGDK